MKIHFSFNKKARTEAIRAIDKLIALVSPTSLLFSIFLKELHERMFVALGCFALTALLLLIKVLVSCFDDVDHDSTSTRSRTGHDTS
ncbi:hypothetical protein [Undibacterium oligocarboniphilum]|uniref:Uncharacterized protein n=1 Tax=Undibacterium oligocarboniphilum TaxID=666702 RepID=A0A850QJP3_9BURK|nr:hypothetical protein [Undibacterium oligocarboniphilum]MBC3871890.1 hypothetical protein [Undibacterium oligocarboniphilum]NVO79488.1 hypothetical protein [Undibacterium oligocarboniphilum]